MIDPTEKERRLMEATVLAGLLAGYLPRSAFEDGPAATAARTKAAVRLLPQARAIVADAIDAVFNEVVLR